MCHVVRASFLRSRHRRWALCVVELGHSLSLGETAVSNLGAVIENFELRDVYGKTHHLTDYADEQLIVVIFVGNDCPLVKLYASRLAELAGEFGPRGVVFLGINSNRQDTLTEVAAFARQAKIEFPAAQGSRQLRR